MRMTNAHCAARNSHRTLMGSSFNREWSQEKFAVLTILRCEPAYPKHERFEVSALALPRLKSKREIAENIRSTSVQSL